MDRTKKKHGKEQTMPDVLRDAIRKDGRTLYRLALDSGVSSAVLGRFMAGKRDMNLRTAGRVCQALKLELKPVRTGRRR